MTPIADNVQQVREQMAAACARAGRPEDSVTLVAVSKKKPAADILAAAAAGVQHFGENRVEESGEKIPDVKARLDAELTWHMVGHIQSRKARHIIPLFQMVHSIDSLKLAQKLSEYAAEYNVLLDGLLEINISGEASKSGFDASNWRKDRAQFESLLQQVRAIGDCSGLRLRGLMTMAPIVNNMEATRPVFAGLSELRDALVGELGMALPDLSMGMTDDFPIAIEEGATLVRVGRAIFGERNI
jgi:hypothetical protein